MFPKNIQGFRTTATIWQILYPPVSTEFAESSEGVWVDVHWPAIRRFSKLHKVSRFLQLNFQIFSLSTDTNTTVVNCVHSNSASYILPSMNLSTTTLISILYLLWSEPGDIKKCRLTMGEEGLWVRTSSGSRQCSILSCSWCRSARPAAMSLGTRSVSWTQDSAKL